MVTSMSEVTMPVTVSASVSVSVDLDLDVSVAVSVSFPVSVSMSVSVSVSGDLDLDVSVAVSVSFSVSVWLNGYSNWYIGCYSDRYRARIRTQNLSRSVVQTKPTFKSISYSRNTYRQRVSNDDSDDDAVDGDRLAEDDADQVLGPDPRGLHSGTQDRRPGREYSPKPSNNILCITSYKM